MPASASLYDRLLRKAGPQIDRDHFLALCSEFTRRKVAVADLVAEFALTSEQQAELGSLLQRVGARLNPLLVGEVAEVLKIGDADSSRYKTVAAIKERLGVS